jgi:single-stranded-DNA-specific exonuclease
VRYLLQRGLERLRHTERLGLRVLMEIAEINPQWLTEEHIGFELAPRLNALGRLADAAPAIELFTTDDLERARVLAHELDGLNARRKMMCDQVMQGAEAQIKRDPTLLERGALVLSHPTWPSGVIGIVAGRLAEKYHRPTILIAAPPDDLARGSARSVPGCDISAAIAAQGEMLEGFGGHPMAAGLSIQPDRIPEFCHVLARTVRKMCGELEEEPLQIDGYVELSDISLDLVEQIERMAPFGPGNPPLTLASRDLSLRSHSTIGRTEEHLQLVVEDEQGLAQRVIWWRGAGERLPEATFDLAYTVRASDYRGQRQVQVEWVEARERVPEASGKRQVASGKWEIKDYRRNSQGLLAQLRALELEDVEIWREGGAKVEGLNRQELRPARALVIWTAPPGPAELGTALERVAPEMVYLLGERDDAGSHQPQDFLKRLGGLVKRALNADGRVSVSSLAATTAQREATVRAGLDWLAARGHIAIVEEEGNEVQLAVGDGVSSAELPRATARLKALLEETRAYRKHFARAEAETVLPEW